MLAVKYVSYGYVHLHVILYDMYMEKKLWKKKKTSRVEQVPFSGKPALAYCTVCTASLEHF